MSRISTGFRRIGIALAVLFVVLAIAWAAVEWDGHREAVRLAEAQAPALHRAKERDREFGTLTLEAQQRLQSGNTFDPFDRGEEPDYAPASAPYAVSRAIGWGVNGFAGGAHR
jgi:hypothetical protein